MSYAVSLVLLAVAVGFAAWRAPRETASRLAGSAAGRTAFAEDCAACHAAAELGTVSDWEGVTDLLLHGTASIRGARTRLVTDHPTFESSSDEHLAAIVDLLSGGRPDGVSGLPRHVVTPADVRGRRARRTELPTSR
jgi:hypothetical protein